MQGDEKRRVALHLVRANAPLRGDASVLGITLVLETPWNDAASQRFLVANTFVVLDVGLVQVAHRAVSTIRFECARGVLGPCDAVARCIASFVK